MLGCEETLRRLHPPSQYVGAKQPFRVGVALLCFCISLPAVEMNNKLDRGWQTDAVGRRSPCLKVCHVIKGGESPMSMHWLGAHGTHDLLKSF